MPHDIQKSDSDQKQPVSLGVRLRSAREELGLERKDVAAQLRLNEKIILMMEKERYPIDLPVTFIRGYIRSYGKFLQIPEFEIKKAVENIKLKAIPNSTAPTLKPYKIDAENNESSLMQLFTGIIFLTILGLVGVWYYSHNYNPSNQNANNDAENENQAINTSNLITPNLPHLEPKNLQKENKITAASESTSNQSNQTDLANQPAEHQNTTSHTKNSVPAYKLSTNSNAHPQHHSHGEALAEADEAEITGLYPD